MRAFNRRQFVMSAASAAAFAATRTSSGQTTAAATASMTIDPTKEIAHVPADFTGLSYESSQLAHPSFFSASNTALVGFFKTLGETGVLRVGGNLSEFTTWSPTDPVQVDETGVEGPDPGKRGDDVKFVLSPRSIRNLDSFLQATGWRVLYGLNLAGGTAESAALEAACVAKVCGSRLVAFQFGNEPDLFKHNGDPKNHWTYDEYIAKWKAFEQAVRQAVPGAPLAGPDTSFKPEWVGRFLNDTKGEVKLITSHYYAEGPPTNPDMTIHRLLTDKQKFASNVLTAAKLAEAGGMPFRMSEGNTCYNAGKQGVSDTFASALWAGDFLAQVAAVGGVGMNLHGGGNGYYTPIAGSQQEGFTARPDFYGMLIARPLAGATLLDCVVDAPTTNVTAYAMQKHGRLTALAFNKDDHEVVVEIKMPHSAHAAVKVMRLTAPAIDATTEVTLGGAAVKADGSWKPSDVETVKARGGRLLLRLPAYSGASVSFV